MGSSKILTTESGAPATDNQHSRTAVLTADPAGGSLLNREARHSTASAFPERVMHAKGWVPTAISR